MKLRWKIEVKNFGGDVGLKAKPVLQLEINGVWEDIPFVEIEVDGKEYLDIKEANDE